MSGKTIQIFTDDIVISGMSGRFPESNSTDEFAQNLYNKVDMITEDNRRWPTDLYGMSPRMGKLKDIEKFDGLFFGIMDTMAETIDPQSRIILETTYEAIIDAGVNPQSLRGSQTGVYIGYSSFGMPEGVPEETQPDSQNSMTETLLWIPGNSKCLYSNRISFVFDFKGPSLLIDTACSSSLVALNAAINDLRLGKCDQAIVGGTQICLQPFTNHIFQTTHLNSADGIPKVWDEMADGFVRGETVACFLLQRKSEAKRSYGTILNSGVNIDGNKRMGMFFPSSESQEELMIKTYKEANIDPLKITYFEAHATGTKVGDQQEAKAIFNAYCHQPNREGSLPVGLLKSNIGHAEGASGVASVAKVLLAFENECIAPNLHLKKLKSGIQEMSPPLFPIMECMPYKPGMAGVNNFGIGGVNAHVLLEPNYKTVCDDNLKIAETIPRLINICCRSEEAFSQMCKWFEDNPSKVTREFLALLTDTMKVKPLISSTGFPIRGALFIKKISEENNQIQYEYKRQSSMFISKTLRQIWFLFPGLGCQWTGMAKALMPIKIFADKVEECHQFLVKHGIDLKHLLLSDDKTSMSTMTNKFCATTAIEIALMAVMSALNIVPDGIIGHSFGEIACAYADGCLTTEEALLITYFRGVVTENDKKMPKGLMAVVGMSWNEVKQICPKGVSVVCNNAKNTVVVSGLFREVKKLIEDLNKKGVFVRELQSSDIPYHSEYLMTSAKPMEDKIKSILSKPRLRSKKWVSTAVLDSDPEEALKYASAEYFVHNLTNPVFFYNKLKHLPSDAVVVELGPHALFARTVTETLEASTYLPLLKRDSNNTNLDQFLNTIAKLYELGLNPSIENLYPKVEWPVSRGTQSISSLMLWDHKKNHYVRKYPDYYFRYTANDMNETIDLSRRFNHFLPDHCIDSNLLFPATGYLMLAWRQLAASKGRIWNQLPVIFEDVQFRRAVFMSDTEVTRLKVKLYDQTGEFAILEHSNVCCCGKIRTSSSDNRYVLNVQKLMDSKNEKSETEICITKEDIYKDLRIAGYDYGPSFRGLQSVRTENFRTMEGTVLWEGNWITFTDSLLQSMAVTMPVRKMMVPVMIKSLRCDPKVLYEAVAQFKLDDNKEQFNEEKALNNFVTPDDKQEFESDSDFIDIDNKDLFEGVVGSKFHMYKSILPFYANITTRMIVTHGLEVEDLMAIPIPRKTNVQDLKLEYYRFVANEDMNAIENCDRLFIKRYLKVCSTLALKTKDILCVNGTHCSFSSNGVSEEEINKYLTETNDNYVLLRVFERLLEIVSKKDKNDNIDDNVIKQFVNEIKSNSEYDLSRDVLNEVSKNECLIRTLLDIVSENNVPKKEIKVLEINLTNGLMAKEVDNHLASAAIYPIDVNYTIAVKNTDNIPEDYKTFNLTEWDPNNNSFPSDLSLKDLVIIRFSDELWSLDTSSLLQETFDSLSIRGFLLTVFRYQLTEPELALNALISGKNQTKLNMDFEKQIQNFITEAQNLGFSIICSKQDSLSSKALLFRKTSCTIAVPPRKDQIFEMTTSYDNWFTKLQEKLKFMNENEIKDENIWLIANDSPINGIIGLINCLRLEPGGEAIRCIFDCDRAIQFPVDFSKKPFCDILSNDLAVNVLKNGKIGTFRHLALPKDYDKIETKEYFLNVGQTRDLSSLQWFDYKNIYPSEEFFDIDNRKLDLINCKIYSAGLNFRDVMLATGRISSGAQSLFTDCVLGLEFAGRRSDTGERVMGFDMSRCFATSIHANADFVTHIPDHWSMEDGVTVLSAYSTVWYGLIERANLQKNESILIHSGAGGVGQAAINICKFYDCDIFVTVGTEEKKKFLMETFNIPENRIFNSRDIQFKFEIKAMTEGRGVDLVLNSLAGDKLEASYECVADCGRFVEIGKYDLQMNKQLGMFSFLKDISLIGVSVDHKLYHCKGFAKRFFDWMHQNSTNGCVKPITKTIFAAEEAEKAFRYMTTGKHIGKIVFRIREEENNKNAINIIKDANTLTATAKTYFNPNKVFIITGGLGGIGLEIIHWMQFLGARKFVLTSRYGVRTDYQKYVNRRIESLGKRFKMFGSKILVSTTDTNKMEGAKELISEAQTLGPIGGIFHLALVLNDCRFENQVFEKFCETVDSKSKTCANLDTISRQLDLNLDYFVVFSSIVCGKGNAGQTNYAYGNFACERICDVRRADGLHGLAIQWGPIDDVGVLAESDVFSAVSGIIKQRINSCFDILDKLLQTSQSVVSCYVRAKRVTQCSTRESRICHQIWSSLGIDPKTTPEHLTLGEIGMESMFAVELQQGLERDYDIKVSLNDIKSITIKQLKDFEAGKQEELRSFAEQIRVAREKLSKIKFIIPLETHSRLNNIKTGKPVYFLPPLEGIFASLEGLAEKINRPVIGLNWIRDMEKMSSLKEITKYYLDLLHELQPEGNYDIVGHFYGALIAMQMLKKRAPIGRAVIIDILSDTRLEEQNMDDDRLIELITTFISKDLPKVMRDRLIREVKLKTELNGKLQKISSEVKEFVGKALVSKDLDEILKSAFIRAKLFVNYRLNMKKKIKQFKRNVGQKYLQMNGKLLIIKPFELTEENGDTIDSFDHIKDAYFLPEKGLEGRLNFETVDTNPTDISVKAFEIIANTINNYMSQ